MPGRIDSIFADLRARKARALMPFVCGGHPGPGDTARVLPALERAGASIAEIGFPFSDPIADGPVIAEAMHHALAKGATPRTVMEEVRRIRAAVKLGLVAMVSVSIVWRYGPSKFIADCKGAGLDGFIFPDLPVDEAGDLLALVRDAGLSASLLVAPTTPPERAEKIAKACSGFVYLLARAGITGESKSAPPASVDIASRVKMLRTATSLPIACGFGIATAADVRRVVVDGGADAAIVGSVLVRRMGEAGAAPGGDPVAAAETLTRELAGGLAP